MTFLDQHFLVFSGNKQQREFTEANQSRSLNVPDQLTTKSNRNLINVKITKNGKIESIHSQFREEIAIIAIVNSNGAENVQELSRANGWWGGS